MGCSGVDGNIDGQKRLGENKREITEKLQIESADSKKEQKEKSMWQHANEN